MDILEGLNLVQREAVETIKGPLLIVAGPGSGKTRVITHRVAYLVKICGINPRCIMAVTFTNKAAREMKERIRYLLGQLSEGLSIGTFHATCSHILRRDGKEIGIDPSFVIYDDEDQLRLLKYSLQDLKLDPRQNVPRAILSAISGAKSQLLDPNHYASQTHSYFEEVVARVYKHYQELLSQSKALDFDDLIMSTVRLFNVCPVVLNRYQSRFIYLLIDEFQDTNVAQYRLAKQLAAKSHNICVVGDPDQAIYSWRHADITNILSFEKDFPGCKVVYLEQSYRSTRTVLRAARRLISADQQRRGIRWKQQLLKKTELWTENDEGLPITVVEAYNAEEEARFVVQEVEHLREQGVAMPGECAVMYRTNAQSRTVEEACIRYGLSYKLVGALRFYQRREVKDVIAYLKLIHNPYDTASLMRVINVPARGIGKHTVEELFGWTKAQGISLYDGLKVIAHQESEPSLSHRSTQSLANLFYLLQDLVQESKELDVRALIDVVLERTGYERYVRDGKDGEERWNNIRELSAVAQQMLNYQGVAQEDSLATFLEGVSLVSDIDNLEEENEAVTLITLHQAKGLEFPVVFIIGMEEGLLPHMRSLSDKVQMEEERRLCYVGITRAQRLLYLVYAHYRNLRGDKFTHPSRFLEDISDNFIMTKLCCP